MTVTTSDSPSTASRHSLPPARVRSPWTAYQREIPRVFCYNRRDTDGLCDLADLERDLNPGRRWSSFTISAVRGEGVFDALKALVGAVIRPLEAAPGRLAAR